MPGSAEELGPNGARGITPATSTIEYRTAGAFMPKGPGAGCLLAVGIVAVLLFPTVLLIAYPIARLLPVGWEAGAQVDVPAGRPGRHGGLAGFHIVAYGTGRGQRCQLNHAYVVYSGLEPFPMLLLDVQRMTYAPGYYLPKNRRLDRAAVLRHLADAGFDPTSAEAGSLATQVVAGIQKLSDGQLPTDRTGEPYPLATPFISYQMAGTEWIDLGEYGHLIWLPWYAPFCAPLWLLASVLASRRLLRRRRTVRE